MAWGCKFCQYNDKWLRVCNMNHADHYAKGLQCSDFKEGGDYVFYEMPFYIALLERFLDTGLYDNPDPADPLCQYLQSLLTSPFIVLMALSDKVQASIFREVMMRFFITVLDRRQFNYQMAQRDMHKNSEAADWSAKQRNDGWQGLFSTMESYGEYGFPSPFYMKKMQQPMPDDEQETLWQKMQLDWRQSINNKLDTQFRQEIEQRDEALQRQVKRTSQDAADYIKSHNISADEFLQAWGMMGGFWSETEFERKLKLVRLQRRNPEIEQITKRMGRTADSDGTEWMSLAQGATMSVDHSSHSDILGVTMGNDLSTLMPLELAQYLDSDTEDLFYRRYLTNNLQVFRHKSEIVQPVRKLTHQPAVRRGPMIVCVDTSGSMVGQPEQIAQSTLMKVLSIATERRRKCFLIGFSVGINAIDVKLNPDKAQDFFLHASTGGTDANRMLEKTFKLLEGNADYMNADVLWITDFRIPLPSRDQLERITALRQQGTCFYGLQIGGADNEWLPYFDEIATIGYVPSRKF